MSTLKKGIILQKETSDKSEQAVETVGSFGLCFIIPQLSQQGLLPEKLGVNSKLRRYRTVFLISKRSRWDRDAFGKQFP